VIILLCQLRFVASHRADRLAGKVHVLIILFLNPVPDCYRLSLGLGGLGWAADAVEPDDAR